MKLISKKTLLLFFLPGAIFMGAFLIYPIFKMVFDSFFKVGITETRTFIGFDNYIKAFTAGGFLKQLKNTLIYILIAVSVETVLGFIFALLFELDYKGSKIVRSLMMTPLMIAPLVAGLIWKLMMSSNFGIVNEFLTRIGILSSPSEILWLADSRWSLIACCIADIWLTTPFMMLMILAGLQGLDTSVSEAARMDGASKLQEIFYIKMPGIKPVLLTALSVRIIDAAKTCFNYIFYYLVDVCNLLFLYYFVTLLPNCLNLFFCRFKGFFHICSTQTGFYNTCKNLLYL